MPTIAILSASVRTGRQSHRVALYFKKYIDEYKLATAEIIDLNDYQFPLFNERLRFQPNPSTQVTEFAGK
ncbi:MAG TPA: NAD(P)H-dependent oxidoreductase, partial [Cyclobacteriaceae bacterium]|nr:NAD(P)H-dependent oxidoreductase [Cyclobacteriaceae bacterium]